MKRKANINDAQIILDFCLELKDQNAKMSFTDFDTLEIVNDALNNPNTHLYIAIQDDIVVAMFRGLRGEQNKAHSAYVACAVKKEYRKQNLATDLTEYGLTDLKSQGVLIARTKIYSWNKASINTIKKSGFSESGRIYMHEFEPDLGTYIDDLIFHRVL
ncbi:MAG: GNAT family N-acetyltransferase [Clostridia bacterium]|nr:GNAT family N-acetyltransferase [Clostridia bacterium]